MNRFRTLTIVLLLSLGASACGSPGAPSAAEAVADPHQLVADGATLLDVRSPAEYAERHLEGATLIPVDEVEGRLSEIPRDAPVVVYCRSGGRSARAAATLRAEGYEVHDLGGIDNW
jgi:phage shock protein E